jgi:hypothetical protein
MKARKATKKLYYVWIGQSGFDQIYLLTKKELRQYYKGHTKKEFELMIKESYYD